MLEDKIKKKRKELNNSIENNGSYEDVYRLSIELDELISEFYKQSQEKARIKRLVKGRNRQRKILYIA